MGAMTAPMTAQCSNQAACFALGALLERILLTLTFLSSEGDFKLISMQIEYADVSSDKYCNTVI